jgi:hypothetical protein
LEFLKTEADIGHFIFCTHAGYVRKKIFTHAEHALKNVKHAEHAPKKFLRMLSLR